MSDDLNVSRPCTLSQVRLARQDNHTLLVLPPEHAPADLPAFEPFTMPALKKSTTDRMAVLAEMHWQMNRRCIGMVLALDVLKRSWRFTIPNQRCSRDSACWSVLQEDYQQIEPHWLLAGSFQSRLVHKEEEVIDAPPPHDGVHFVMSIERQGGERKIWTFYRFDLKTRLVPAEAALVDDWEGQLREALPRLKLV